VTRSTRQANDVWRSLTETAATEQALLEPALASLFTDPDLDQAVARALGYPDWPQPLTLLHNLAPTLTTATPQLAAYLEHSEHAAADALQATSTLGWPDPERDGASSADAAWLLLQHADRHNDARAALLPDLARAVDRGRADPRHLALLTDRERTIRGEPQRYGTFVLVRDDLPEYLYPVEEPHRVDEHRARIHLPSLTNDAKYAFSPIIPYGPARTTPVNPWRPRAAPRPHEPPTSTEAIAAPAVARPGSAVYLAASLRHRNETARIRDRLPPRLHSTARWLDIDPLTRPSCQFDAGIALNRLAARLCLADIQRAETVIAIQTSRRSAGVGAEIGYAVALDKPVLLVGSPRCSFDMLPQTVVVADIDAAIAHAAADTRR
jgi:Family of unknown function (DUF6624)/Nucleoside 2-deoxyribosyltransferase